MKDVFYVKALSAVLAVRLCLPGLSNLSASLGHTGRTVVLGHTLNTLQCIITKKSQCFKYIYNFVLGCIHSHPGAARWTPLEAVGPSFVVGCNSHHNYVSLHFTLYLKLKDNLGKILKISAFQKMSKYSKPQIKDYVIFKLCFKLDHLGVV